MEPRPFQTRVAQLLLSNKNVILQAPTGAGKTGAALLPLLHSIEHPELGFPQKCIYAVPMRVLATQFIMEWERRVRQGGRSERLPVNILTGEAPHDPKFEAGLTFATIDQVLSSYLLAPYSLSSRLANFNAGAIVSSYLVFDEFHLFDPHSTLPTTLEMLSQLNGVTPFLLMTATFSQTMLRELANKLNAEIVPDPENQAELQAMQAIPSQHKTRCYHAVNDVLTADAVLRYHDGGRTLVICNSVSRAQALYEALDHKNKLLLHSRFLQADRRQHEQIIRDTFAEHGPKDADTIVISTQAIEVGLDITCRTLLTELAPANAVVQRAGRCARYEGEKGDVYVFARAIDPLDGEETDLRVNVKPYVGQEEVVERTWAWLSEHSDKVYSFADEQALISEAHGEQDRRLVEEMGAKRLQHLEAMAQVAQGGRGQVPELVRNVRSFRVTIHSDPAALLDAPFAVDAFSLPKPVAFGVTSGLLSLQDAWDGEGAAITGVFSVPSQDADEANQSVYQLRCIQKSQDIYGADLLVIHPDFATYSPELGLLAPRRPGDPVWEASLPDSGGEDSADWEQSSYRLESYEDHVRLVWQAFDQVVWPEAARAARMLEARAGWLNGSIRRAAELVVLLHDVGKLQKKWQHWAHRWQEEKGNPIPPTFAAAHTDYNADDPAERERTKRIRPGRPPHAGEGAYACLPILAEALDDVPELVRPAFTAILRHHTPFANHCESFSLIDDASQFVLRTFEQAGVSLPFAPLEETGMREEFDLVVVSPIEDINSFLAYLLLVRVLRRADQEGTKQGARAAIGS